MLRVWNLGPSIKLGVHCDYIIKDSHTHLTLKKYPLTLDMTFTVIGNKAFNLDHKTSNKRQNHSCSPIFYSNFSENFGI